MFSFVCKRKGSYKKYKPYLDQIDLTYTQYITMLVLWEYGQMNVKELGDRLYLDSGTLTPLLKKLESKGMVIRKRSVRDERNMTVSLTEAGLKLREKAVSIPEAIGSCIHLTQEEMLTLYRLLYKILGKNIS